MSRRELGPCIICRQRLSASRDVAWKIDSRLSRLDEVSEQGDFPLASKGEEITALHSPKEESELFHVDCARCKSSSFVMIVPGPFHAKAIIQTLTDLTKKDLTRMNKLQDIDADELLSFYGELKRS